MVIMKSIEDGTSDTAHSHALVAGTNHSPCRVTAAMAERSKIKSFVKVYHDNHLRPTAYSVGIPLDETVANKNIFRDPGCQMQSLTRSQVQVQGEIQDQQKQIVFPEASVLSVLFNH